MGADMGRGGGYDYQWVLSFYLFTLMKNPDYILDKSKRYPGKDFSVFVNRMNKFKEKCIKKYGDDFEFKVEILVEGEEKCLDDITFISNDEGKSYDNNIFIQVKTKGGDKNNTISTSDGIYKAITNFLFNINFQKYKNNENILFFIFTNKELTKILTKNIESKLPNLYLDFINYITGLGKSDNYPNIPLKNLHKIDNYEIVLNLLNGVSVIQSKYLKIYSEEYLVKLFNLVSDLKIIFNNLDIIVKIDDDILEYELETFYGETVFLKELRRISKLCFKGIEVSHGTPEFQRYENYKFTYFKPDDGGQTIDKISVITKGKFI